MRELVRNCEPTEIVALPLMATMELKECQLLACLHTLSEDCMLKTATHADDSANDDGIR
jgi:hypothetical protein